MSINISYGPIGAAMGLAAQAGQNQGAARSAQAQQEWNEAQLRAQQAANEQYGRQIQMALGQGNLNVGNQMEATHQSMQHEQFQANNQLQQQTLQQQMMHQGQQMDLERARLDEESDWHDTLGEVYKQKADAGDSNAEARKELAAAATKKAGVYAETAPENAETRRLAVDNTANKQPAQADPNIRIVRVLSQLRAEQRQADQQRGQFEINGRVLPGLPPEQMAQWANLKKTGQARMRQMADLEMQMQRNVQRQGPTTQPSTPPQSQANMPPQAGTASYGPVHTNPATGERIRKNLSTNQWEAAQ